MVVDGVRRWCVHCWPLVVDVGLRSDGASFGSAKGERRFSLGRGALRQTRGLFWLSVLSEHLSWVFFLRGVRRRYRWIKKLCPEPGDLWPFP